MFCVETQVQAIFLFEYSGMLKTSVTPTLFMNFATGPKYNISYFTQKIYSCYKDIFTLILMVYSQIFCQHTKTSFIEKGECIFLGNKLFFSVSEKHIWFLVVSEKSVCCLIYGHFCKIIHFQRKKTTLLLPLTQDQVVHQMVHPDERIRI